ncbi:S-ribosylhomocysteine lyase [Treponema pectinovorum]|uniref:S-ribosylhomocysteine lyase n=1 Tax=Treponema pectinovorum TaxID=164 RepID=UPI0011CCB7E3|nr:S-ribosylhomocysteine lyase [Treponema pectinovorum]
MPELKKYNVDSFNLDHRLVKAPYIRIAAKKQGAKGDWVTKFDVRVCQPNKEFMGTGAIHAMEHIIAEYLRDEIETVIDFSPMGCRTGFYLTVWGDVKEEDIVAPLLKVFEKVANWQSEIPAANEIQCGNYRDMDLDGARKFARQWIEGISKKGWKPF